MSFSVDSFVESPSLLSLGPLKKAELLSLAEHYKLEATQTMRKAEIRSKLVEYLVDEEIISEEESESTTDTIELRKLELQDKEKEREAQLKMKELEIREQELAMQLKIKELELTAASTHSPVSVGQPAEFDVSKQVRFVPPFQEREVDKYFLHFEKVATSLSWPKRVWTLLLQGSLLGKARDAYSALSVEQSSDYDTVKRHILKAYELVPEAYRQRFRTIQKVDTETFVEFAREKENAFDRWCTSKEVNGDFGRLRQLIMMEEFKNCLPADIRTYLDEQRVDSLHEAAVHADDYSLTHIVSFGKSHFLDNSVHTPSARVKDERSSLDSSTGRDRSWNSNSGYLPAGPTCFYCRKKGHIMSECQALQANNKTVKPDLLITKCHNLDQRNFSLPSELPAEYAPFVLCGSVSFVGSQVESQVTILRDTGASQSLILGNALPFSSDSDTGETVLLQGAELRTFCVPLHKIHLSCDLVTGPVVVGVRPTLPIPGVSLILGNDLAGERVVASPCVFKVPQDMVLQTAVTEKAIVKSCSVNNSSTLFNRGERKVVGNQIFVGRLPKTTSIKDLENIFLSYGKLTHCELKQGMHLAYGFIEFEDKKDAEKAICQENGRDFMGTRIAVEWSKGCKEKNGGRGHRYFRKRSYSWSPSQYDRSSIVTGP